MNALILASKESVSIAPIKLPNLQPKEVLVKLRAAALNRRDFWCTKGLYPNMKYPSILGSDGCGVVVKIGTGVNPLWLDQTVIINPSINWGDSEDATSNDFTILGMPKDGTFAEYVSVDVSRLHRKPHHLSDGEAAALPLAGVTAFRATFVRGQVRPGQKVFIPGIGSGVSTLAAQFAVAEGAEVWISSSSNEKIEKAVKLLGVKGGVNYKEKNWISTLLSKAGMFDVIIDGAGGPQFSAIIVKLLRNGGKLVTYGATAGLPTSFPLPSFFLQQKIIIGSTMGSDRDFEEMTRFVSKHKIIPLIDSIRPFGDILSALKQMEHGEHMGKLVISFPEKKDSKM